MDLLWKNYCYWLRASSNFDVTGYHDSVLVSAAHPPLKTIPVLSHRKWSYSKESDTTVEKVFPARANGARPDGSYCITFNQCVPRICHISVTTSMNCINKNTRYSSIHILFNIYEITTDIQFVPRIVHVSFDTLYQKFVDIKSGFDRITTIVFPYCLVSIFFSMLWTPVCIFLHLIIYSERCQQIHLVQNFSIYSFKKQL